MAISPQRLTIYLHSTHRAVVFVIAQLSCFKEIIQIGQCMKYVPGTFQVLAFEGSCEEINSLQWNEFVIRVGYKIEGLDVTSIFHRYHCPDIS